MKKKDDAKSRNRKRHSGLSRKIKELERLINQSPFHFSGEFIPTYGSYPLQRLSVGDLTWSPTSSDR